MDFHTLMLFGLASLSINLIPGPDVIYIVSNTMKGKMKFGIRAALGLGVGYFIHTLAAVMGLSALVLNSALAFTIVKYLGAAYLLYLGFSSLKNMFTGNSKLVMTEEQVQPANIFKQGVIVSVLNPKVALFFLSFLPQFITPGAESGTMQLLTLGVLFSVLATLCNIAYAIAGNWLFSSPKAQRFSKAIEGVSGVLLVGLAGKIALTR
ncbi:LysE family translocator [Vibrio sp. JC009]|uniref:LysE family translocator n=1 Tax=Vibrio sp. JC009 TaxID=2912314 RepID=UPI0023AEA021|nr:LysE family translocator [Vibrio sp. JC009]WED24636.1 LysE family translocator [Vibrio sp. JC009]